MATPAVPGMPNPEDLKADAIRQQFGGVGTPVAPTRTSASPLGGTGMPPDPNNGVPPPQGVPAPTPGINPGTSPTPPGPPQGAAPVPTPGINPGTGHAPPGPPQGAGAPGQTQTSATTTPAVGNLKPDAAFAQLAQQFQARFGRAMTAQEQQQLQASTGYTSGDVTPEMMTAAQQAIANFQPGGATPTPAPTPPAAGELAPDAALAQTQQAFLTRFGRAMTPQEQTWLQQMTGYTSGNVTAEQMSRALDAVGRYTGNVNKPIEVTPAQAPETAMARAARERLTGILGRSETIDPNDPVIKGQQDAYDLNNQRGTNRTRAALAERSAARGGINAGGFDTDTERLLTEQGERGATFGANLQAQEMNTRRRELMQGIQMAQQYGLQSQAQQLQEQLGRLDIQLRGQLGRGQLGLGLLGLNQQNTQFNDNLGLNLAQLQAQMNNDAYRQLFGS